MKYQGYISIEKSSTFGRWLFARWNYAGPRNWRKGDRTPVQHIGIRLFGHSWEKQIEIRMGEL